MQDAAVARGEIWLCAFGPAVLHDCTPLNVTDKCLCAQGRVKPVRLGGVDFSNIS